MDNYLFGTTYGDVLIVRAEARHEAYELARNEGYRNNELRYYGWLKCHIDELPDDDSGVVACR